MAKAKNDLMQQIVDKIIQAQKDWRKRYPHSWMTPWDAIYLKVETREDGSRYIGFNPSNQQHINSWPATVEAMQDWLDGKVTEKGLIKSQEHWDELLWICRTGGGAVLMGYEIEYFNGYKPEYLMAPGQVFYHDGVRIEGKGLPKKMLKKAKGRWGYREVMTRPLVEAVEKYIKWIYKKDMQDQLDLCFNKSVNIYDVTPRREADEKVYGFTYALKCLGLETCGGGFGNTPKVRENFAWWRNLLKMEAKWDLWVEKGIAYEPWVKNRKSTYSKMEEQVL